MSLLDKIKVRMWTPDSQIPLEVNLSVKDKVQRAQSAASTSSGGPGRGCKYVTRPTLHLRSQLPCHHPP